MNPDKAKHLAEESLLMSHSSAFNLVQSKYSKLISRKLKNFMKKQRWLQLMKVEDKGHRLSSEERKDPVALRKQ